MSREFMSTTSREAALKHLARLQQAHPEADWQFIEPPDSFGLATYPYVLLSGPHPNETKPA